MLRVSPFHGGVILLAALAACEQEPGGDSRAFTAPSVADHEVYFPIASGRHQADCNRCHGEFDTFREFSCIGCHEHAAAETDPWHLENADYGYERRACYTCHPRGTVTPGFDHRPHFPIEAGAKHADRRCAECHVDATDRRKVSCIDCHEHAEAPMGTRHQGIAGYAWSTPACLACHKDGSPTLDHRPYYPIGAGTTHAVQVCADCHLDPNDRKVVSCIDCHEHLEPAMATVHQGMGGYLWATASCLSCHRDGNGPDRTTHDRVFPISGGTKHAPAACSTCHESQADRTRVKCIDCHPHASGTTLGEHVEVGGYAYQSVLCERCHADGTVYDLSQHRPFLISSGSRHRPSRAGCLDCHPDRRTDKPFGADFRSLACGPCHSQAEMDGKHRGRSGYRYDARTCIQSGCHPDGRADD